ncbi:DUF6021 family protein [Pseudomonas sp. REB1044]|uniref:DUF6021 family protein n=1 Tax=Pseudomonas sp. REB1044 TaxID=2675224 RepID=UPI00315DA066
MSAHKTPSHHNEGPHSSEGSSGETDLDFDPDSPDLEDPQVDPIGKAIAPKDHEKKDHQ